MAGSDHFSKSLVKGSNSIALEANSSNPSPNPPARNRNNSPGASSLLSPISDQPHKPNGPLEMQPIVDDFDYDDQLGSGYFKHGCNKTNQSFSGSDASIEEHDADSEDEQVSSESSEYIYDVSFTEMMDTHFYGSNFEHCYLCGELLYKEQNEIFIYKGEYTFCSPQCRQVKVGYDEFKEKAARRAQTKSDAKRLEDIGKYPVVFSIGSPTSASTNEP